MFVAWSDESVSKAMQTISKRKEKKTKKLKKK